MKNVYELKDSHIKWISTGFKHLDQLMAGLKGSNLITICGANGVGKRSLAYNIAINAASKKHLRVIILNLTMGANDASMRLLCSEAKVDRSGFISRDDWDKLVKASESLIELKIMIADDYNQIFEYKDYDLLIIDSFQRLNGNDIAPNIQQEQISYKIANEIKSLAILKDIPIIVLSSLNDWSIEKRSDKRPTLTDFKYGYSALPDISDIVISIYRDEIYNKEENNPNRGIAEITILKQRNGPTGTALLSFLNSFCRFENYNEP